MRKLVILGSALSAALSACTGSGTAIIASAPTASIVVAVDRDFDLAPGQSARVDGSAITISFIGVTEDSRCPVGVQCVWAGNAALSLSLMVNGDARSSASLNTTLTPRTVRTPGYEVSLVALSPEPKQGVSIPQATYVATLRVVRQ